MMSEESAYSEQPKVSAKLRIRVAANIDPGKSFINVYLELI